MTTATASRPRGITVRVVDVRPPIIIKTDLHNFQSVVQKLTGKRKLNETCGGISDDDDEYQEQITNEELEQEEEEDDQEDQLIYSTPSWSKCSYSDSRPPTATPTKPDQERHGPSNGVARADDGSMSTNWSSSLSSEEGVSASACASVPQQEVTSTLMDNQGSSDVPSRIKRAKLNTTNPIARSDHYVMSMDSLVSELLLSDYNNINGINSADALAITGCNNSTNNNYYTSLSASSFNDHFDFINNINLPDINPVNCTTFHEFGELDKFSFPFFNI